MSRQVRQRLTAVLLGGLLLGAAPLASGMADAGQTRPSGGGQSHPALVTVIPSTSPTPTPTPLSVISVAPSHGSAIPDSGTPPRIKIKTKIKAKIRRSTGGSSVPTFAGKPPGARKASVRGVPTLDLPSPTDSAPAASARPGPEIATQQVATTGPMSGNGLIGLLAAVSIVLVLGVSAGVIRAIVSERASRTKIA